jgi:hypothetical protein
LKIYPDDYTPVRAGGPKGDTKMDGYCPKAKIYFAAHATRGENISATKKKIRSDLEGCLKEHKDVKKWVYLTNDTLLGEVEQSVEELRGLENLSIRNIRQDDGGLDLSDLKKLRHLRIMMRHQTTRVGNEVVFTWDAYHDSDLMSLSGLTNLEDLSLTGSGIGDAGLKHLAALTNLKHLQIQGSANLTADGLKHLANMRRLDSLFIGDSRITGQGLAHLYPLKTLHIIRINSAIPIGGQAIARLRTELPHLQSLDISQPKPPARRPQTSKPRARLQASPAKPRSARTRNNTRRGR